MIKFIQPSDHSQIAKIIKNALVRVEDEKNELSQHRDLLIELYNCGMIKPNSNTSYILIRNASTLGRIWLVNFLISKGVPSKNIPSCNFKTVDFLSKQLEEILTSDVSTYYAFSNAQIERMKINKKILYDSLKTNNHI